MQELSWDFKTGFFAGTMNGWFLIFTASLPLLMVFSLAITPEFYQARSHRWRKIHTVLNCIALLFLCQRLTASRYLLEIRLNWQK
ncbi:MULTISPECIES: DUF4079 family protein [unclassified Microcoleus]|uniref:DUF4079 family protein n=1 Tax=unclassified Microcoleus TaxID=2642155 RepID=UPI002FD2467C